MLIVNTPICPRCTKSILTRQFSTADYVGMVLFLLLFFPVSIWIYLNPRSLYCQSCGTKLNERPPR